MLDRGDAAVLDAPIANFAAELDRMRLANTRLQMVGLTDEVTTYADQATDAELADLSAALKKQKSSPDSAAKLYEGLASARQLVKLYRAKVEKYESSRVWVFDEKGSHLGPPELARPKFPSVTIPDGLPGEFSDYLEGALAWYNPDIEDHSPARAAWEKLLARPAPERHFKSTWAAYMLGRAYEEEDAEKAIGYYQQVRTLARHGFADSTGLATASLGWEARLKLQQGDFEQAIELYLEQLAAGDSSAYGSLRTSCSEALENLLSLPNLAMNPRTQRVITAYLVSRGQMSKTDDMTMAWLDAVESAGIKDVDSAEKLALAAYQNNQPAIAQRWINRSGHTPVAQWLQVKLLLQAGKLDQAASLLTQVAESFPVEPPDTNNFVEPSLAANLSTSSDCHSIPAGCQVLGELGVLRLTRREYTEALDCLLKAGFWMDAAYVAERMLSLDELKNYVDQHWPAVTAERNPDEKAQYIDSPRSLYTQRQNIRYLLARRLTRSIRGSEARPYYPVEFADHFDNLVRSLGDGWNESLPPAARANALRDAAFIARTNGLELLATELQPDWAIHGGSFEEGITWENRVTNSLEAKIVPAGREEIIRASHHNADPEERYHYRYQAAFLGWTAATLMPNNSEETARILCVAGSWLKNRDPETADVFYKALVRRNRKTALGAEADRRHWFPNIDSFGNMIQRETEPQIELIDTTGDDMVISDPLPENDPADSATMQADDGSVSGNPEPPQSGFQYEVVSGDTLIAIARHFANAGLSVTAQQIMEANPGVVPEHIMSGQKLLIPFHSE
jgi:LysM repeat protein